MSAFEDNFRQMTDEAIQRIARSGVKYNQPTYEATGNWPSGALKSVSKNPNVYTRQSLVEGKWTPKDPTTDSTFVEKYRSATQSLGSPARAWKTRGQERPNVDAETKAIMDRIKLPTYQDALSNGQDAKLQEYMDLYQKSPGAAEEQYYKDYKEWDDNNFYYKLRAAQALKNMPEQSRENILNSFNISMYDAKNDLDKIIQQKNRNDAVGFSAIQKGVRSAVGALDQAVGEGLSTLTGQRQTYTDDNGVKHTIIKSGGPANLEEFSGQVGDSFQMGQGNSLEAQKALEETKQLAENTLKELMGKGGSKSGSNSAQAKKALEETKQLAEDTLRTLMGKKKTGTESEDEEVVEYTYKPGDYFSKVLLDLGLSDGSNLWGENGDVEYYTKQLENQLWKSGVWPQGERQNIPIGTTIKLKRRK